VRTVVWITEPRDEHAIVILDEAESARADDSRDPHPSSFVHPLRQRKTIADSARLQDRREPRRSSLDEGRRSGEPGFPLSHVRVLDVLVWTESETAGSYRVLPVSGRG
jgi:hypothetical protein